MLECLTFLSNTRRTRASQKKEFDILGVNFNQFMTLVVLLKTNIVSKFLVSSSFGLGVKVKGHSSQQDTED